MRLVDLRCCPPGGSVKRDARTQEPGHAAWRGGAVCDRVLDTITEFAAWVAVLIVAFEQGGAAESGRSAAIQLIPAAVAAPFIAAAGDRFPRGSGDPGGARRGGADDGRDRGVAAFRPEPRVRLPPGRRARDGPGLCSHDIGQLARAPCPNPGATHLAERAVDDRPIRRGARRTARRGDRVVGGDPGVALRHPRRGGARRPRRSRLRRRTR